MALKCKIAEAFSDTIQSMFDRICEDFATEHRKSCTDCREEHHQLVTGVTNALAIFNGKKHPES